MMFILFNEQNILSSFIAVNPQDLLLITRNVLIYFGHTVLHVLFLGTCLFYEHFQTEFWILFYFYFFCPTGSSTLLFLLLVEYICTIFWNIETNIFNIPYQVIFGPMFSGKTWVTKKYLIFIPKKKRFLLEIQIQELGVGKLLINEMREKSIIYYSHLSMSQLVQIYC